MQEHNQYRTARRRPDDCGETSDALGRHCQLQSHDLKNTRDLRTLLLDAAYVLQAQPELTDAHIYLHNCALAKNRVEMEVDQFRKITRPNIAGRVVLHDIRATAGLDILVHGTPRTDLSFITELDPGLERYKGRAELAHVVVHFIDRPAALFVHQVGQNWGALPISATTIGRHCERSDAIHDPGRHGSPRFARDDEVYVQGPCAVSGRVRLRINWGQIPINFYRLQ